jgi:hypothetical protein
MIYFKDASKESMNKLARSILANAKYRLNNPSIYIKWIETTTYLRIYYLSLNHTFGIDSRLQSAIEDLHKKDVEYSKPLYGLDMFYVEVDLLDLEPDRTTELANGYTVSLYKLYDLDKVQVFILEQHKSLGYKACSCDKSLSHEKILQLYNEAIIALAAN